MISKKLPQVYKLDLENSFIKKFERSQLCRSLKSSQITRVRLQLQKQPKYKINEQLKELSDWNEQKKHHKKIKYFPRGKSSEASIEGNTSKKMQQIFLLLPYHCSSHQKKYQCKMMWKKLILGVEVILFYKKLYKEQLLSKTASCPHIPPRRSSLKSLNYPSSPKRKLRSKTQGEGKNLPSGFGNYINAMYESEKLKKEIFSRSVIAKEFKCNDSRIKRLVTSKICDYTLDLSRNRCISSKETMQLRPLCQPAPYKEENSRIKRVSSTLIRRVRTQRQY